MHPEIVTDLAQHAVFILLLIICVLILPSLAVSLVLSIFQAATQINEQSLIFMSKLIVTFITFILACPWIIKLLTDYTNELYESVPSFIR